MSKIFFDDGKEVELSKETEKSLREQLCKPKSVPVISLAMPNRIIIRLKKYVLDGLTYSKAESSKGCSFSLDKTGGLGVVRNLDYDWTKQYLNCNRDKPIFGEIKL